MKREYHLWRASLMSVLCLFAILVAASAAPASGLPLKEGVRIVVAGSAATADPRGYTRFIELYLTVCRPDLDAHILNLGAPGTIESLSTNAPELTLPYKPDIVTTCYGYEENPSTAGTLIFAPTRGKIFSEVLRASIATLTASGVMVIVGSPVAVDTHYFYKGLTAPNVSDPPAIFNETLARYGELAREAAESSQMPFADIHADLYSVMKKAKAVLGDDYCVCGSNPQYPAIPPNGNLVISYSFLKAMGLSGDIGTITIDMKGPAKATDGHKILSGQNGTANIESSRYPFCFTADENGQNGTRGILPFVPFNQDLNRFMLVVKNLGSEKAKVTWGTASKDFTKNELESGINLAEAFAETNPFSEVFKKIDAAVVARQTNVQQIHSCILNLGKIVGNDPDGAALRNSIRQKLFDKLDKTHADIQAMVTPLAHTLTVTPE